MNDTKILHSMVEFICDISGNLKKIKTSSGIILSSLEKLSVRISVRLRLMMFFN